MSRPRSRRDAGAFLLGLEMLMGVAGAPRAVAAARDLLLAVELNDRPLETVVQVTEAEGRLFVSRDDGAALGLSATRLARAAAGQPGPIALDRIDGVTARVDDTRQMLLLTAEEAAVGPHLLGLAPALRPADKAVFGVMVNYDLFAEIGRTRSLAGLVDARVSTAAGTLNSGLLAQTSQGRPLTRLSTTLARPEIEQDRVWQAGDVVTGGLAWTRPFRMGGVQVQTAFSMRPDLVTYPVPVLSGRATVPSSVDVLVNGVRQFSESVEGGPFAIRQPPVMTGAGQIALVTRDPFGQQSVQTVPFYVSPSLLAAGLSSTSVEAGLVRRFYGQPADRYGMAAASGTWRRGLREWITGEAHVEGSGAVQMGGIGVAVNAANLGIATAAVAASRSTMPGGRAGAQVSAGFERAGPVLSVGVAATLAGRGFRDVPALAADPVPRQTLRASLGLNLFAGGSLRAAYVATSGGLIPLYRTHQRVILAAGQARIASLSYARPLGLAASLYATAYRDLGRGGGSGAVFGISMAFGAKRSASAFTQLAGGRLSTALDAAQSALVPGEFGLRAHLSTDLRASQVAEATGVSHYATGRFGVERVAGLTHARTELQGALAFADGQLFAANRIADSYAVVDTQGQADVPVLLENRIVGRTDATGRLLVPDLRGWGENRLSLDPTSLAADVETGDLTRIVRPPDHAGIVVAFPFRRGQGAVIRLIDSAGRPVPVGAQAVLRRSGQKLAVGHDGEVFASGLQGDEQIDVAAVGHGCTASFHFTPQPGDIPVIGPVTCAP